MDLSKAFDSVSHEILLSELPYYGITDNALKWFASYLSCRTQRVCLGNNLSNWGMVSTGVPQGSILGPLLFILFVNDLSLSVTHSQVNMYADDTELHYSDKSLPTLQLRL